jgi:hypothetical protein
MKVLSDTARSPAQYCLKNRGKKPAITVVANAELAQSYMAQEIFCLLSSIFLSLATSRLGQRGGSIRVAPI